MSIYHFVKKFFVSGFMMLKMNYKPNKIN